MALAKIADLYPNYKEDIFSGQDIKNFSVYDHTNDKIGSVYDIIVDETGKFRYLVIDTGFWVFGKKVLLPVGKASIDYAQERIYAKDLTKEQVESLPEYDDNMTVDYDYEERVRTVYRGVDYDQTEPSVAQNATASYSADAYSHDREPSLYHHAEVETDGRQSLKLYEERLIANKERFLAGTVKVGKRVETETASVSVPVEKERVVIERTTPTSGTVVPPGEATFGDTEVARIEVYEETADVEKQAFVREEVNVRKEVEQDTVTARETIRREELDVESDGDTVINRDSSRDPSV
ncbi:photosystem reaction center subunit H [Pleurocapsa sp. CCALA 161]|uniref:DUF2382 domain-containing protein n=1 Tax=Pleurocapsa sp. CCALA 161 TaxID=2107688 RepID=UPI000D07CDD2|nr:DUF2382 domain-containing protein [Pleurocapsa sp. CCALA 161]PSB08768.1 photosystem reaction center subunit H [Pleurocapsa sp. CCALA 161]